MTQAPMFMTGNKISYLPGEVIVQQGQHGNQAYIVLDGTVCVYRDGKDGRVDLGCIGRHGIFGEMALIDDQPRSASVVAKDLCTCLIINRGRLDAALSDADPLVRALIRVLTSNLRATTERLSGEEAGLLNLKDDLAAFENC